MVFIYIVGIIMPICMCIAFLYTKIIHQKDKCHISQFQWIVIMVSIIISLFIIVGYTVFSELKLDNDRETITQQTIKRIAIDEVDNLDIEIMKDAKNKDKFSVPYENEIYDIHFHPNTASIKEIIKESDNDTVEI
ncbi:hypothetical protein OCA22_30915 [Bacillus cereus]|nr:hypothetical protein [Bacillus cereus]